MRALPGGDAPHLNGTTGNGGATHASQLRQLSHGALRGDGNRPHTACGDTKASAPERHCA